MSYRGALRIVAAASERRLRSLRRYSLRLLSAQHSVWRALVAPDHRIVRGELDIATADQLSRFVEALPPADCRWIHLDLAELVFIDAAGLTALIRADIAVKERSGRMTIGRPQPLARLLIEVAGLPIPIINDGLEQGLVEQTG